MKKYILLLFTLVFCVPVCSVYATHLRAGQIAVEQLDNTHLTFKITITVFTNTKSTVLFGGEQDELDFGDGSPIQLVPETQNTIRRDLNPDGSLGIASFTTYHTYSAPGQYLISYREPNRNEGVLNMDNSVNTTFYVETLIHAATGDVLYKTPVLLMERPVLWGNLRFPYSESVACMDSSNYDLYYELTTPLRSRGTNVTNYRLPDNMTIDPISGLLTWDTKFGGMYVVGEYAIAVKIYQLKDNQIVGYMHRDFQLILSDDVSEEPSLNGGPQSNTRVDVPEGKPVKFRVAAGSSTAAKIYVQVKSELDDASVSDFQYVVRDSVNGAVNFKVAEISFTNQAGLMRNTPYIISVRGIYDNKVTRDLSYIIATNSAPYDYHPPLPGEPGGPPTPIEDEPLVGVAVVPNPVKDVLEIQNKSNATLQLSIHDLMGRTVHQQTLTGTTVLDLRRLQAGVYVCVLVSGSKVASYKIVKE